MNLSRAEWLLADGGVVQVATARNLAANRATVIVDQLDGEEVAPSLAAVLAHKVAQQAAVRVDRASLADWAAELIRNPRRVGEEEEDDRFEAHVRRFLVERLERIAYAELTNGREP